MINMIKNDQQLTAMINLNKNYQKWSMQPKMIKMTKWSKSQWLTEKGREKADAIGQHGAFDNVQFWQDDEGQQGHAHRGHGLEQQDHQKIGKHGFSTWLENANPRGSEQRSQFRDDKWAGQDPVKKNNKIDFF